LSLLCLINLCNAHSSSNAGDYSKNVEEYFLRLLPNLSWDSTRIWKHRLDTLNQRVTQIIDEHKKIKHIYKEANAEGVFAFKYLNAIRDYETFHLTILTNDLGETIWQQKYGLIFDSLKQVTNDRLDEYSNTENAKDFFDELLKLRDLEKKVDSLKNEKYVKYKLVYAPTNNAYAQPYKIETYVVYDWDKIYIESNNLIKSFNNLEGSIRNKEYLIVKDGNATLTLLFQVVTLLVLIIGLLKNYGFKVDFKILAIIITSSLIVSIYLMFNSKNTVMNILVNITVPSVIFLMYFLTKKRSE